MKDKLGICLTFSCGGFRVRKEEKLERIYECLGDVWTIILCSYCSKHLILLINSFYSLNTLSTMYIYSFYSLNTLMWYLVQGNILGFSGIFKNSHIWLHITLRNLMLGNLDSPFNLLSVEMWISFKTGGYPNSQA